MDKVNLIKKYLIKEFGADKKTAELQARKFADDRVLDIANELLFYIKNNKFTADCVIVEGYTAKALFDNHIAHSGYGAFNLLRQLRLNSQETLIEMKKDIPIK